MSPLPSHAGHTVAAETASQALRRRTADLHEALEARLPLLRGAYTRADYGAMLQRLHALYLPLESALAAHAPALAAFGLAIAPRRKLPALARDLAALGLAPRGAATAPPLPDVATALGCLYVVEGATLGGRLIATRLARPLGIGPGAGADFLLSYGAARGRMWRAMAAVLDAALAEPVPLERAVAGARATFGAVGAAMLGGPR